MIQQTHVHRVHQIFVFFIGTHWCHEILSMLLSQSVEYNTKGSLHHMYLEFVAYFMDKLDEVDDPRLFTIHLPLHHLPTHHVKNGYKMIYLNRNPKDRWVSNYTFLKGKLGIPDWTWDEFFDNMILKGTRTTLVVFIHHRNNGIAAFYLKSIIF